MKLIMLDPEPFPKDQIPKKLEENKVFINRYAEEYFSHPRFSTEFPEKSIIIIVSLWEIGLEDGSTLDEIYQMLSKMDFRPCSANAGLFLRFVWKDQPQSDNSVLSGTHEAPDQAVTVLSDLLDTNDDFPKGLYLRNVDGRRWLRGYVCDSHYRFPGNAMFAFEAGKA